MVIQRVFSVNHVACIVLELVQKLFDRFPKSQWKVSDPAIWFVNGKDFVDGKDF